MKIIYCENGHFFDVDAYETCPRCGAPAKKDQKSPNPPQKKFHWADLIHKKEAPQTAAPAEGPILPKKVLPDEPVSVISPAKPEEDLETLSALSDLQTEADVPSESTAAQNADLEQQVQQSAKNRDGKTYGYFQEIMHSSASQAPAAAENPVVGWLVAIKGPHIGASFVLHDGKNSIGRNAENDVVLGLDNGVSRSVHATVIFEPKKQEFYLQPGSGSALTYYNEEFIADTKKIPPKARIGVGGTTLLLCPLCGPDFSWEEAFRENQGS